MSFDTLDLSRVEAVLFDVGGVFFIPSHVLLRPLLTDLAVDAPDDDSFRRAHYVGIRHCEDELEDDAFWTGYNSRYVESLGIDDLDRQRVAEAIHGVWLSGMRLWTWVQDDAVAALARIAKVTRVGIVSNADGTVERDLGHFGVCQVGEGAGTNVEVIIDSTVVGVSKPNPEIFRFALEAMNLQAEQCLYVGDAYRYDVVGASRAGLQALHFDPYELHDGAEHARARSLDQLADLLESLLG
ncbi:MAG: HAD family hydrolase [Acidimicrobiales bacterium]